MLRQTYYLIGGGDYVFSSTDVVIPAGNTRMKLSVSIMNDNTVETDENFILMISSNLLPNKISATTPERATITIVDDDGLLLCVDVNIKVWEYMLNSME